MSQIWTLTNNHSAAVFTAAPSPETFLVTDPKVTTTVAWPEFTELTFCHLSLFIEIREKKVVQKQSKVKTPKVKVTDLTPPDNTMSLSFLL